MMSQDLLLRTIADTCRDLVRDAVSGISVCTSYDEASLIGFMQLHQLLGLRRLMLPMAAQFNVSTMAESVFDCYLNQLEDVKNGSRSLLQTTNLPLQSPV
jgi:hypothetical protein